MNPIIDQLSQDIFALVAKDWQKLSSISSKTTPDDIVSSLDLSVDKLITDTLHQAFPNDVIVTEESSADQFPKLVAGESGWVVDPICGSMNVVRGIKFFTTNIIRVEQGRVTAAWVLDHCLNQIIWSEGQALPRPNTTHQTKLIDLSPNMYLFQQPSDVTNRYVNLMKVLQVQPTLNLRDLGSSLSFSYISTGQIDGGIVPFVKPWDILAACFLVEKSGGIATYFDGQPWDINTTSAILANTKETYELLKQQVDSAGLNSIH